MSITTTRRPGALTGLRASTTLLRFPVLALGPRQEPIHFRGFDGRNPVYLSVSADEPGRGLATLADGDVLIFVATLLTDRLNAGEPLDAPLLVRPGAILRALGRPRGGRQHALITEALARLAGTTVSTNIGGTGRLFTLLDTAVPPTAERPHAAWTLASSFLAAEVAARRIVRIDPAALALHGLERRLYEWARVRAGGPAHSSWTITLERARDRAASQDAPRRFRHAVKRIVRLDRLPGFTLALQGPDLRPSLVITRRTDPVEPSISTSQAAPDAGGTAESDLIFECDTFPAQPSGGGDGWDPEFLA